MRNSIGRFYETQASHDASYYIVLTNVDRAWHRPSTPLPEVVWGIRNNVNLQQSALLIALGEVAVNRDEYLRNFYQKSLRSVAKATTEGPAAYVMPADDPRPGQQARMRSLLQRQGIEVHRTTEPFEYDGRTFPAGSYVARMDQPFSRTADMLLDKQYYNPADGRPYDDTGWNFGPLYNVDTVRVEDAAVLHVPMQLVTELIRAKGEVVDAEDAIVILVNYNADNNLAAFRFAHRDLKIEAAEVPFTHDGREYRAGTFIIHADEDVADVLSEAAVEFGFVAYGSTSVPSVPTHPVSVPRIALVHTWQNTQDEGWVRIAFDEYGIPYDYISVHDVRDNPNLAGKYDVIVFGPTRGDALSLVRGVTGPEPIMWKPTEATPNIGRQAQTDDMRGGLELQGVLNLYNFVRQGGTFITMASTSALLVHFGLAEGVSLRQTQNLWAPGGVYSAERVDASSPLLYGYDDFVGVYFNQSRGVVLSGTGGSCSRSSVDDGSTTASRSGRGGLDDVDVVQGRPVDMWIWAEQVSSSFSRSSRSRRDRQLAAQQGRCCASTRT